MTEICLELTCPSGHKTKIFAGQKIACKTCGWEPLITWDGKSHFLEVVE